MDPCSRRILAWTLQPRRDGRVTRHVVTAGLRRRQPAVGPICHSDRGSKYLGATLRGGLAAHGVRPSDSTRGPGDNAHLESFFHVMKAEATRGRQIGTAAELRKVLRDYIRYYITPQAHSALAYCSPSDFARGAPFLDPVTASGATSHAIHRLYGAIRRHLADAGRFAGTFQGPWPRSTSSSANSASPHTGSS
jgi:hypothetical protein